MLGIAAALLYTLLGDSGRGVSRRLSWGRFLVTLLYVVVFQAFRRCSGSGVSNCLLLWRRFRARRGT
jgi:hypothetical protein